MYGHALHLVPKPTDRLFVMTPVSVGISTLKDFPIPPNTNRIAIRLENVSTNGASGGVIFQLGTLAGVAVTGYDSSCSTRASENGLTSGFHISLSVLASYTWHAYYTLLRVPNTDRWIFSGIGYSDDSLGLQVCTGTKTLSQDLTTLRLTTNGGADSFDGGTIAVVCQ
jgi:hypothetical protein